MPKQDPRVVAAADIINRFFKFIAEGNADQIVELIKLYPTLVFARDAHGNTAMNNMLIGHSRTMLEIASLMINTAREQNVELDLSLKNHLGQDAYTALLQIDDHPLFRDFCVLFETIVNFKSNYKPARESRDEVDSIKARLEIIKETEAESGKLESGGTSKLSGSSSKENDTAIPCASVACTIMNLHEIKYNQNLKDIFQKQPPLNFDQQKQLNKIKEDKEEIEPQLSNFLLYFDFIVEVDFFTIMFPYY